MQDMFARLLVNATNPSSGVEARRAFVSILQDFGPLEARLLVALCRAPGDGPTVRTAGLPDRYIDGGSSDPDLPSTEVQLALWNLTRLGCIEPAGTWGGGSTVGVVSVTALGYALYRACSTESEADIPESIAQGASLQDTDWGVKWQASEDRIDSSSAEERNFIASLVITSMSELAGSIRGTMQRYAPHPPNTQIMPTNIPMFRFGKPGFAMFQSKIGAWGGSTATALLRLESAIDRFVSPGEMTTGAATAQMQTMLKLIQEIETAARNASDVRS